MIRDKTATQLQCKFCHFINNMKNLKLKPQLLVVPGDGEDMFALDCLYLLGVAGGETCSFLDPAPVNWRCC